MEDGRSRLDYDYDHDQEHGTIAVVRVARHVLVPRVQVPSAPPPGETGGSRGKGVSREANRVEAKDKLRSVTKASQGAQVNRSASRGGEPAHYGRSLSTWLLGRHGECGRNGGEERELTRRDLVSSSDGRKPRDRGNVLNSRVRQ